MVTESIDDSKDAMTPQAHQVEPLSAPLVTALGPERCHQRLGDHQDRLGRTRVRADERWCNP